MYVLYIYNTHIFFSKIIILLWAVFDSSRSSSLLLLPSLEELGQVAVIWK
jgi:hypothetical protein